jgi:tRNA pseudouridine38-40 synthase
MNNYKVVLAYDGTAYFGWQKNGNGPSIEEKLQNCFENILQHSVTLQAASRTDRGVHAKGQVINFFSPKALDLGQLCYSLNQLLPNDIVAIHAELEKIDFHPTLDCLGKEYHYYICSSKVQYPEHRHYSWHVPQTLDLEAIRQAFPMLIKKQDFSSFCNTKGARYQNFVRTINSIQLIELEHDRLCFVLRGDHFLYRMVRIIVGTLIGIGKKSLFNLNEILNLKTRSQAGVTAPAHGLFLYHVFFR